jgi:hypothetical protein
LQTLVVWVCYHKKSFAKVQQNFSYTFQPALSELSRVREGAAKQPKGKWNDKRKGAKQLFPPSRPGTGFTNISTIFLSFFYLFSIFFLNRF